MSVLPVEKTQYLPLKRDVESSDNDVKRNNEINIIMIIFGF